MFHPIRWWRQRRIRSLQLRLLGLDMEIDRLQKYFDLLVSTIKLANGIEGRLRCSSLGIDIARCQLIVLPHVSSSLNWLEDERFGVEKEKRELEFLISQN